MLATAYFEDRERALRSRGVPAHLARQPFEGALPDVPGSDLVTWSGGPEKWAIALHGVPDAGKSMLAAQLMWLRLPYVKTAAWWRASRLIDAHFGLLGHETRLRTLKECYADLLVIDDLGHSMGHRGLAILSNLIASRHDENRATIITTHLPLVTLSKLYPEIGSRLTSETIAIPFDQTYKEGPAAPVAPPILEGTP